MRVLASALLLCLVSLGCSRSGSAPLDTSLARSSLVRGLDAWRSGQPATTLRQGDPEIIVVDFEWEQGAKLLGFELTQTERSDGRNFYVDVDLVLATRQGKRIKQTVGYVVGTSPVVTVARQ